MMMIITKTLLKLMVTVTIKLMLIFLKVILTLMMILSVINMLVGVMIAKMQEYYLLLEKFFYIQV